MAKRVELNQQEMEGIVGGILRWTKDGVVCPQDDPSCKYGYTDYYDCQAWLVKNWDGVQNEDTLIAMEEAGLVYKL